jgi:hypothetical protein
MKQIVTQIKVPDKPIMPIDGLCYNDKETCKFAGSLPLMPGVQYCACYQKRLVLDWPFPTRLPECRASEDWFAAWKNVMRWAEI